METNKIKHKVAATHGKFYMGNEEHNSAELTYSKADGDKIIIDHTWVDPKLRNQGVGESLIEEAVTYARHENMRIIALCTFAKSVFEHHPEMTDVLMENS